MTSNGRDEAERKLKVLVGVDFSGPSELAIREALLFARESRGATLHVAYVVDEREGAARRGARMAHDAARLEAAPAELRDLIARTVMGMAARAARAERQRRGAEPIDWRARAPGKRPGSCCSSRWTFRPTCSSSAPTAGAASRSSSRDWWPRRSSGARAALCWSFGRRPTRALRARRGLTRRARRAWRGARGERRRELVVHASTRRPSARRRTSTRRPRWSRRSTTRTSRGRPASGRCRPLGSGAADSTPRVVRGRPPGARAPSSRPAADARGETARTYAPDGAAQGVRALAARNALDAPAARSIREQIRVACRRAMSGIDDQAPPTSTQQDRGTQHGTDALRRATREAPILDAGRSSGSCARRRQDSTPRARRASSRTCGSFLRWPGASTGSASRGRTSSARATLRRRGGPPLRPDCGARFAVCAAWWIRAHLQATRSANRRVVAPPSTRNARRIIERAAARGARSAQQATEGAASARASPPRSA